MAVTIRTANPDDQARCLELLTLLTGRTPDHGWQRTFSELLTRARGTVLVAEHEGAIVGVATSSYNLAIRYSGEYAQLEELIVDPAARGLHAGGLLVQATIDAARARGCGEIGLYLVAHTEGNRDFYARYGFEVVGTEMRQVLR